MRSRTSYFNRTLFLKTVTRFWPIWFIYFAVWFVAMPLIMSSDLRWGGSALSMQSDICNNASIMGVLVGFSAACVAAMAVWSFMCSARSTSGMASLPLRRECVFVSVSLGGIVPLLCVNVLIFVLCLGVQAFYGMVDAGILGQWLAAVSLELVFFYGFALVCAQLTGNLAVLPLVYLVLNFVVYVVEYLFRWLATAFVYGAWSTGAQTLTFLSPAVQMLKRFTMARERVYMTEDYYEVARYYLSGWGVIFAYAAVGLVFTALALWLYRRRRMESAGDVVAVNILKPVFKYCMTFGCALCVGALLYEMSGGSSGIGYALYNMFFGIASYRGTGGAQWAAVVLMIIYMLIGAFIGYFASEMLIHKSFRVWRGRGRWLGLGVSALVVVALMLSMELDMYGYERRVPEPDRVKSVSVRADSGAATVCEPENIAAVTQLHRSVVENKRYYESFDWHETDYEHSDFATGRRSMSLYIDYELENGSRISRRYFGLGYYLGDPSTQTDARAAQNLVNTPEAIAWRKATAIEYTAETIFDAQVNGTILPGDVEKAAETAEVYDDYGNRVYDSLPHFDADTGELLYIGESKTGTSPYSANWSLTPQEAAELYSQCILPDMADGTIGTVWIITDEEYENTVYDARISMDARVLRGYYQESGYYVASNTAYYGTNGDYRYEHFYTVPTVNSVRTNRWLEEHGVILRTIAETGDYIAEYGG